MTQDISDYNYDLYLKFLDFIESNFLCPYCKKDYLLSLSPFSSAFICPKCNQVTYFNMEVEYETSTKR